MNPNATWDELLCVYREEDEASCRQAALDLTDRLAKDCSPPIVTDIPSLDRVMVQAVCTHILDESRPADLGEICS
jgi:hypothetical protein